MTHRARLFTLLAVAMAALWVQAAPASAGASALAVKIDALGRMMTSLAPASAQSAAEIRRVYEEYLEFLVLDGYADIEGALTTGGLVLLPDDPLFNLVPRLEGPHPIGEMDLANQGSYVSARAFTVGCLLEIASRVRSSPIEITSLVRHGEYQHALRETNSNATTSVPMHTMGLAADIALVNTPLATAYEVRDILLDMQEAGDLFFIGERQQLVFHVVPHPSRLGHFMDVYSAALGVPAASRAVQVVARAPSRLVEVSKVHPKVSTEVISILPADESLWGEWFAEEKAAVEPAPAAPASVEERPVLTAAAMARGFLPMFGGLLAAAATVLTSARRRH